MDDSRVTWPPKWLMNDLSGSEKEPWVRMKKTRKVETTLEDLMAAASEVAFEYSNNAKEAHNLAQFAIVEMLKRTAQPLDSDKEFESLESPSRLVH